MNRPEAEAKYHDLGLGTRLFNDTPGETGGPHAHEGVYLYTLGGSAKVRLDGGEWQNILPGQEIRIEDGQLHQSVAGPEGWEYMLAASSEFMRQLGL